jgi:GNAT superfamily N-acetyltransferase
MALNLRDIEIFRPYPHELPEVTLARAGLDDVSMGRWLGAETLRIAKLHDDVAGVYAMDRMDTTRFNLHGVVVVPALRKQGLGRWLIGHAIGVAESKGGRYLHARTSGSSQIYARIGFSMQALGYVFAMIQE